MFDKLQTEVTDILGMEDLLEDTEPLEDVIKPRKEEKKEEIEIGKEKPEEEEVTPIERIKPIRQTPTINPKKILLAQ